MGLTAQSPVERRNFRLNLTNGVMMLTANAVTSPELVMTAFAAYLTSNKLILGLIAPLPGAMWSLPQLFMIERLQARDRVLPIYRMTVITRIVVWAALITIVMSTHNATILLITLLTFMVSVGLLGGIAGLPFVEITGKTIAPRRRGQLFSLRQTLGSILAILGTQIVIVFTGVDSHFDFPMNYGMLFIIAAVLQTIGASAFSLTDEPPADSGIAHPKPSLKVIQHIWQTDSNYRHYVQARTLLVFSSMANGLVLIYANEKLGVRLEMAGIYLMVSTVIKPVFSFAAGQISMRYGSQVPVVIGQAVQTFAWLLVLLTMFITIEGRHAEYYFFGVFGLIAIQQGLVFPNLLPLGLNVMPGTERALYMGTLNTWVGVITLVSAFSGVIVETTGFEVLFVLTALLAIFSGQQFSLLREKLKDA
ncbi:MAG: hypothetical protein JXA10_09680 [Anaerolineae bacterium]|nr:hypothetical protein [Anaerolineae bacterium]